MRMGSEVRQGDCLDVLADVPERSVRLVYSTRRSSRRSLTACARGIAAGSSPSGTCGRLTRNTPGSCTSVWSAAGVTEERGSKVGVRNLPPKVVAVESASVQIARALGRSEGREAEEALFEIPR